MEPGAGLITWHVLFRATAPAPWVSPFYPGPSARHQLVGGAPTNFYKNFSFNFSQSIVVYHKAFPYAASRFCGKTGGSPRWVSRAFAGLTECYLRDTPPETLKVLNFFTPFFQRLINFQ